MSDAEIDLDAWQLAAPGALRASLEYYRTFAEDAAANKAFAAEKLATPALGIGGDRLGPMLKGIMAAVAADSRAERSHENDHPHRDDAPGATVRETTKTVQQCCHD